MAGDEGAERRSIGKDAARDERPGMPGVQLKDVPGIRMTTAGQVIARNSGATSASSSKIKPVGLGSARNPYSAARWLR